MKKYDWILFDADETLFHFDSFRGLQIMFSNFGIDFTKEDYVEYQAVNKSLWIRYQNGDIKAQQLQHQRFQYWSNKLKVPPQELNSAFLKAMAGICAPLEGAVSLLNSLKGKVKLGIVTNGFNEWQQVRLERTGFNNHFDILVSSEQVGFAKPHPAIFEYAFSLMGEHSREHILMVGDTLESDILGGINVGIDTCWLNANKKSISNNIKPHLEISSLLELEKLFVGD